MERKPRAYSTRIRLKLPKLPVLGWSTFSGEARARMPCVLDATHIRYTCSGRAAIAQALRALDTGAGDKVLVPTYHCPTMIAPIVAAGAEPLFFPIDATGAPCLRAFAGSALTGVKAIIAAHYFGLPQPMRALREFCDERGIALIEDCAHALFGSSDGRPVGEWGDFAIASLTKFLPVVDGGCLVASRPLADISSERLSAGEQLKSFANSVEIGAQHGHLTGLNSLLRAGLALVTTARKPIAGQSNGTRGSDVDVATSPTRFSVASIIDRPATAWTRWIVRKAARARIAELRRRNYLLLAKLVDGVAGIRPLVPILPPDVVPYVLPLYVDDPAPIYHAVRAVGIPVFRWDEVWPTCPAIHGDHGRSWGTHVFQIGCHQDLSEEDLVAMVDALRILLASASTGVASSLLRPAPSSPPAAQLDRA